jgi:hypothetical protein
MFTKVRLTRRQVVAMLATAFGLGSRQYAQSLKPTGEAVGGLTKVSWFGFGGMGFVGVPTQGEKDYEAVLRGPSPEADFEKVFTTGTPAAKAYALAGLYNVNPKRFAIVAGSWRSSNYQVQIFTGCVLRRVAARDVVAQIDVGGYQPSLAVKR